MARPHRARGTLLLTLALAAGCQDYNFNPVGHCLIQPGTKRVTLSSVSSADVLFVVDDSGSMGDEQADLATNFTVFITNLDQANAARRTAGLEPFDFHIAVTSTSMFWNYQTDERRTGVNTCRSDCGTESGHLVCCTPAGTPARTAKKCSSTSECTGGTTCGPNCISFYHDSSEASLFGENHCCVQGAVTIPTAYPAGYVGDVIPCSRAGVECGTYERHYDFDGCGATGTTNGVAVEGWPLPQGDFVSWTSGAAANPRVLHFDKSLYPAPPDATSTLHRPCATAADCTAPEVCAAAISTTVVTPQKFCRQPCGTCPTGFACVSSVCQPTNAQTFTSQELVNFFSGGGTVEGNIKVGVCGSGQEQALGAARAAIEKARAGQQKDTYARNGRTQTWDSATRTAQSPADWLAAGTDSKLVVVFVGDEDDCSASTDDPSAAVVWDYDDLGTYGVDSCARDALKASPAGGKLRTPQSFADYFTGLGREVAFGFIFPAAQQSCTLSTCTATAACGGASAPTGSPYGVRLLATAQELATRGVDVVAGSICDPSFASLLDSIAEIVKPPSGLTLPSVPADTDVTLLRIAGAGGQTRKVCNGPLEGTFASLAAAQATKADWWFTTSGDPAPPAAGTTAFVYINPAGSCLANPGETYSADYLGRVPATGCRSHAQCRTALGGELIQTPEGGTEEPWTCFAGVSGEPSQCVDPATSPQPGTCLCGPASQNCPRPPSP